MSNARIVPPPPLVFITGASSGLGQALALEYARRGWRLALAARRGSAMRDWAGQHGLPADRCHIHAADVAAPDSIHAAAQQCLQLQGVPQVVIANAGISQGVDIAIRDDLAAMQRIWATNVQGLANTFQPFIGPMRQRGSGTLAGIASVAGIRGLPGHAAYCASKAGAIAFCESLRGDLRGTGVKVTTISPGFIATPMTAGNPFPMPFLLPADQFAARAFAAIQAQTRHHVIPWQMGWVARLLRILPDAAFDYAASRMGRKPRAAPGTE